MVMDTEEVDIQVATVSIQEGMGTLGVMEAGKVVDMGKVIPLEDMDMGQPFFF